MLRVRKNISRSFTAALCFVLIFFPMSGWSQEDISYREGSYEIFYSAFNTSFLSPEVAKAAGIERAKNRGMLNISVIEHVEKNAGAAGESPLNTRPAEVEYVKGEIFDLVHNVAIEFREVVEPSARYHLGTFKIANDNEFKEFRIKVLPKDSNEPIEFRFKRNLFID